MQTTTITVVSEVEKIPHLPRIAHYIEEQCPYFCLDMTTEVELKPGDYKDVILARDGPYLVTKQPIVPWPPAIKDTLASKPFLVFSWFMSLMAYALLVVVFFVSKDNWQKNAFFLSGMSVLNILHLLNMSVYRGKIVKAVIKRFDFWYLTGVHLLTCVGTGFLYYQSEVDLWLVCTGFGLYAITFPLVVFCIDASLASPRIRSLMMISWFLTYTVILLVAGFAAYLWSGNLVQDFVYYEFDIFFFKATAQSAMVATMGTLLLFFIKYTVLMWRGSEYVVLTFEVRSAKEAIGSVEDRYASEDRPFSDSVDFVHQSTGLTISQKSTANPDSQMEDDEPKNEEGNETILVETNTKPDSLQNDGDDPGATSDYDDMVRQEVIPDVIVRSISEGDLGGSSSAVDSLHRKASSKKVKFEIRQSLASDRRFSNAEIMQKTAPRRLARRASKSSQMSDGQRENTEFFGDIDRLTSVSFGGSSVENMSPIGGRPSQGLHRRQTREE